MNPIRVAVVQAGSVPFDRECSVEKARALTAEAASLGAQLVVFPEAFVSGYPKGLDFGARVGMRSTEGNASRGISTTVPMESADKIIRSEKNRKLRLCRYQ
jgi:hypothetical protein